LFHNLFTFLGGFTMTRKFFTVFLLMAFLLPGLLLAQSHLLKADGSMQKITNKTNEAIEVEPLPLLPYRISDAKSKNLNQVTAATADTMTYRDFGVWNSNFGQFGQDVMLQWFVAPADMEIHAVSVNVTDAEWDQIEIKIIKGAWTAEQFNDAGTATARVGYYEASGRPNDANPFADDETTTGPWVSAVEVETQSGGPDSAGYVEWGSPFGEDLWSDFGAGAPVTLVEEEYTQWLNMNLLFVPEVLQGEVFCIALINTSSQLDLTPDPPVRTGFMSSADRGIGAWKYYAVGRNTEYVDWGWWHRDFTWDIQVAVNLTSDRAPVIHEVTQLLTTTATGPFTVDAVISDDNPAGGDAGVANAVLHLSIDSSDFEAIPMTGDEPDFTADIPSQSPGAAVAYYVETEDVLGNSTRTPDIAFSIYAKTEDVLFLYNVGNFSDGTARFWYMGGGSDYPVAHDYWSTPSFGIDIIDDILAMYDYVIQVDGTHPEYDLTDEVAAWLQTGTAGAPKMFFWSSQDNGDNWANWPADTSFTAGSFYYDYMGVSAVTNQDWPAVSMRGDPWLITPVMDDPVSGWADAYNADSSVLHYYDPAYETGMTNYMDNFELVEGGNAAATFSSIDSAGAEQTVGVRNNGEGFYTAWIAFDYMSTNFRSDLNSTQGTDPGYAWGVQVTSQPGEFLAWGGFSAIEIGGEASPRAFRLAQNYPNPFNPETTIEYSIPNKGQVTLKIFDIRGREVATLVDNNELAGLHKVTFDASNYASGVYFYQLKTNDKSTLVKKMMLLK
jgi:hypothetical protein